MDEEKESAVRIDTRPFALPGKHLSEEFLRTALELHHLVSAYGIESTPNLPETNDEFLVFYARVHDGWKEAQRRIATLLTERLLRRSKVEALQKQSRNLRDRDGQKAAQLQLQQIGLEIVVLRRMLDVVLWTIFAGEHSTLRRLFVEGGQHNLSVKSIADALPAAEHFNKEPQVMALCTDMLSAVHVGDLLIANRERGEIAFAELKSGEKNFAITAIAEFAVQSKCAYFEQFATAEFDETDKKHFARVKRQAERNETIVETIRNEGGSDPNTGAQVFIHPTEEPTEFWSDVITACYSQLSGTKRWAIDVVDRCLYVGVYSSQQTAFIGFQSWMAQQKCESRIYNLTDSFFDPGTRPLGAAFLPFDLREKILRGDILVIMCLDIVKMIELTNKMQPGYMRLATKKESAKMRQKHPMGDFTLNGLYVRTNEQSRAEMFLGGGFRDRILFDQHRPAQLIAQNIRSSATLSDRIAARHPDQ
jgi:hypothetical protein